MYTYERSALGLSHLLVICDLSWFFRFWGGPESENRNSLIMCRIRLLEPKGVGEGGGTMSVVVASRYTPVQSQILADWYMHTDTYSFIHACEGVNLGKSGCTRRRKRFRWPRTFDSFVQVQNHLLDEADPHGVGYYGQESECFMSLFVWNLQTFTTGLCDFLVSMLASMHVHACMGCLLCLACARIKIRKRRFACFAGEKCSCSLMLSHVRIGGSWSFVNFWCLVLNSNIWA